MPIRFILPFLNGANNYKTPYTASSVNKEDARLYANKNNNIFSKNVSNGITSSAKGSIIASENIRVKKMQDIFELYNRENNFLSEKFSVAQDRIEQITSEADDIIKNAALIKHRAESIYIDTEIKNIYNNIVNLLDFGEKTNYKPVYDEFGNLKLQFEYHERDIYAPQITTIKEYENSELKRQISVSSGTLTKIVEYEDGDDFKEIIFSKGKLYKYAKGHKGESGNITDEKFLYSLIKKGTPTDYFSNIKQINKDESAIGEHYLFLENGQCASYEQDAVYDKSNCNIRMNTKYEFNCDKLENAKFGIDKERKVIDEYFVNANSGHNCRYCKNFKNLFNFDFGDLNRTMRYDDTSIAEIYGFVLSSDNKLIPNSYIEGYSVQDGIMTTAHEFYFSGDSNNKFINGKKVDL